MTGTLDDGPDALPPIGEFFTGQRCKWMPQIPGQFYFPHPKLKFRLDASGRYVPEEEDKTVAQLHDETDSVLSFIGATNDPHNSEHWIGVRSSYSSGGVGSRANQLIMPHHAPYYVP